MFFPGITDFSFKKQKNRKERLLSISRQGIIHIHTGKEYFNLSQKKEV